MTAAHVVEGLEVSKQMFGLGMIINQQLINPQFLLITFILGGHMLTNIPHQVDEILEEGTICIN